MIKDIGGYGFENYKSLDITLNPGINFLVGPSDKGKSTVIKLLVWIFRNDPKGDGFRNDALKVSDIVFGSCVFDDDSYVVREKGKNVNQYVIDPDTDPLAAIRTSVPQEVKDITRMYDVNIQTQHPRDQYFMLADKPGQVAKMFNKVSGFQIMDKASTEVNSRIRTVDGEITIAEKEIKTKKEDVENLEWVSECSKQLFVLEKREEELNNRITSANKLGELLDEIKITNDLLRSFGDIDTMLYHVEALIVRKNTIAARKDKTKALGNVLRTLKFIDSELETYTSIDTALTDLKSLEKRNADIDKRVNTFQELGDTLAFLETTNGEITKLNQEIKEMDKTFHTFFAENECPLCGEVKK